MYKKISELTKLDANPRTITDDNMRVLVESIKNNPDYFEARPLIVSDRTGELVIIGGNQRYEAAKLAGLKKVPVCILKDLTEDREREITVRDNVNNGKWDWDVLGAWGVDSEPWGLLPPKFEEVDEININKTGLSDRLNDDELRDSMSVVMTFNKADFIEFMTYVDYFKVNYGVDTVTKAVVTAVEEYNEHN